MITANEAMILVLLLGITALVFERIFDLVHLTRPNDAKMIKFCPKELLNMTPEEKKSNIVKMRKNDWPEDVWSVDSCFEFFASKADLKHLKPQDKMLLKTGFVGAWGLLLEVYKHKLHTIPTTEVIPRLQGFEDQVKQYWENMAAEFKRQQAGKR